MKRTPLSYPSPSSSLSLDDQTKTRCGTPSSHVQTDMQKEQEESELLHLSDSPGSPGSPTPHHHTSNHRFTTRIVSAHDLNAYATSISLRFLFLPNDFILHFAGMTSLWRKRLMRLPTCLLRWIPLFCWSAKVLPLIIAFCWFSVWIRRQGTPIKSI